MKVSNTQNQKQPQLDDKDIQRMVMNNMNQNYAHQIGSSSAQNRAQSQQPQSKFHYGQQPQFTGVGSQQYQARLSPFAQQQQTQHELQAASNNGHLNSHSASVRRQKQLNDDDSDIESKLRSMLTQVPQGDIKPQIDTNINYNDKSSPYNKQGMQKAQQMAYTVHNSPINVQVGPNRRQDFFTQPKFGKPHTGMLGPQPDFCRGKKTLVLDLDETLVHSQFKQVKKPDYVIPVDIEGRICNIFVLKRPGTDYFLQQLSKHYELVIYTASLSKYADPLMFKMDPSGYCTSRLFREHCTFMNGIFVKDLSLLGRPLKDTIIIDNSPTSYMLQPECALPILSWYDDMKDKGLFDLIPLLIELSKVEDVRDAIPRFVKNNLVDFGIAMKICSQVDQRSVANNDINQELKLSQQASSTAEILTEESAQAHNSNSKQGHSQQKPHTHHQKNSDQKYQSVKPKMFNHQKLKSADLNQPLINPWVQNNAQNIPAEPASQIPDQPSTHKRQSSLQTQEFTKNSTVAQPPTGTPGSAVTNITNIIYNFNLTPSQQLQIKEQQQQEIAAENSQRRPQTSKQATNRESNDIDLPKNRQPQQKMMNTLEILQSELKKDELMFYDKQNSKVSHKKRPQTGSLNARVQNKNQKIEILGQTQPLPGSSEKRSHSGVHTKQSSFKFGGISSTPKNNLVSGLTGLSNTQKLQRDNQYYQKLIQANDFMQYDPNNIALQQKVNSNIPTQRDQTASLNSRQKQHTQKLQSIKVQNDYVNFQSNQVKPQVLTMTPQNKKQHRSHSSSNNSYPRNNNLALQQVNEMSGKIQRNNQASVHQTPKHNTDMINEKDSQEQQQDYIKHQPNGSGQGQIQLSEKYAAILSKNLEESSNLAKTLRNTKAHLYDKLRNSYQNATQLIQKAEESGLYTQNLSPKQGLKPQTNRYSGLNATDKLKIDYKAENQGIFLNFASSPQNQQQQYSSTQNQRYNQKSSKQSAQGSFRSSLNNRPQIGGVSLINGMVGTSIKGSKTGFEATQKFEKNELQSYQQQMMMNPYSAQFKNQRKAGGMYQNEFL